MCSDLETTSHKNLGNGTNHSTKIIAGSVASRSVLGISALFFLLALQFHSDDRIQSNSADLIRISTKNTTTSATYETYYDPPTNYIIKKRQNVVQPESPLDYNIIIIHYHKTGHAISNNLLSLLDLGGERRKKKESNSYQTAKFKRTVTKHFSNRTNIQEDLNRQFLASNDSRDASNDNDESDDDDDDNTEKHHVCSRRLSRYKYFKKRSRKRWHFQETNCPKIPVHLGKPSIVTAPDLFCSVNVLDGVLNPNRKIATKIIHMVRDPFEMALSNYFYHSQQPTPENWVKKDCNPCDSTYYDVRGNPTNTSSVDIMLTTLETVKKSDIDAVKSLCESIFQNPENPRLADASFYDHLLELSAFDGLRLTTSRQLVGSGGAGGHAGSDIMRMTTNAVKLDQLVNLSNEGSVQIMTTYMHQWTRNPYGTALGAVEFLFGNAMTKERKDAIAREYDEMYETKASDPERQHVTSTRNFVIEQKKKLVTKLKEDVVLSPVLREMQKLLKLYS